MDSITVPVKITDLTPIQIEAFLKTLGEPASHADRLLKGIYRECGAGFEDMAGLSASLKQKLTEHASLGTLEPIQEKVSADGQTWKVLFRLEDNNTIESALMLSRDSRTGRERRTVCVSSQVGCAVGCRFCATGQQGFERNLSPGEMVCQVLYFMRRFQVDEADSRQKTSHAWLTNVVFMGMGEPLANYDNVLAAITILNSKKGMGLGVHQVTLSTSGLVPQILQLAGEKELQFQLAVSLHAGNDDLRDRLVPINKKYPLHRLISACKEYQSKTGRNIFIEYALFDGINDSINDAEELVRLLHALECSINLIYGNPTNSNDYNASSFETAKAFQKRLMGSGIRTMLRVPRGNDIEAGCGQLRSRWNENKTINHGSG